MLTTRLWKKMLIARMVKTKVMLNTKIEIILTTKGCVGVGWGVGG